MKREIEELHDAIAKYNNEIVYLKTNFDVTKTAYNTGIEDVVGEKEDFIVRLRKDLASKDIKIHELDEQVSQLQ